MNCQHCCQRWLLDWGAAVLEGDPEALGQLTGGAITSIIPAGVLTKALQGTRHASKLPDFEAGRDLHRVEVEETIVLNRALFSQRPTSFDPMDASQLRRIKEAFKRQGKTIDDSEDALRYLELMGAMSVPPSSEGHIYSGPLKDGYWVDAADMKTGYRLLNADASWAEVVSVDVVDEPMNAYNLTVADYHTYFVAANENAAPVWVHNTCLFGDNVDKKLRKHSREIYQAAAENGTTIARGDKGAMKTYISGIVEDINKRNVDPFEWSGIMVNGYVKGNSIIIVRENGEFLTHLTNSQKVSSYLKGQLGL